MRVHGSLATILLIVGATDGCAARAGEDGAPEQLAAEDEPLGITVDSLDVVHGALRLRASMVDGAADVTVRLGGDCEPREVGGGLSTRSTLVWLFGETDVADAIGCGLVVRARLRDGARSLTKRAELGVLVDVAALDVGDANDGPQLQAITTSRGGVGITFARVSRGARLTTRDSILEAESHDSEEEERASRQHTGRFTVPQIDFARSVLSGRRLSLDGLCFVTSLSVGGQAIQVEPEASDEPQGEVEEQTP